MNELSKYLVGQVLLEESSIKKTVVVYVGRFQPFHKGHNATYQHLVKKFGKDNVFIGTSNKVEKPKSPFNFKEKVKIMTTMFGIPSSKIVQVKNPYAPTEVLSKFDENTTAFITVVGEKDSGRLGGKYFTPWKGEATEGYKDRGYVYAAPAQPNAISGTDVRNGLSVGSEEQKQNFFTDRAYPNFNKTIFKMITDKLNESICITKETIEEWLISEGSKMSSGQADDGPTFMYPNYNVFKLISAERAKQIGFEVVNMIMTKELEDYYSHPTYPNGPVQSVSYFPAGVIGANTPNNQVDIYSQGAYSQWYKHATRKASLIGYQLVDMELGLDKKLSTKTAIANKQIKENIEQILSEEIKLPVEIGDTILMGKFKNKKVVVKSIGTDEHGMPTINGKKVVTFRLVKEGFVTELAGTSVQCEKCNHSWKITSEDTQKYLCHSCGWDSQKQEYDFDGLQNWKDKVGLNELAEMAKSELDSVEKFADSKLSPEDIEFTKHFFDRVNDPRNDKPISSAELTGFFKRLSRHKKQLIDFLQKYQQIVVKDKRTDINIPFVKTANQIIAKTIMRKSNFQTSNPILSFEQLQEFDRSKFYEEYYKNISPSNFKIVSDGNQIKIKISNKNISEGSSNVGFTTDGEPDGIYLDKGQTQKLGVTTGKRDYWFKNGGYTQVHFPAADSIYGMNSDSSQERRVTRKIKNVTKSTLPAPKPDSVPKNSIIKDKIKDVPKVFEQLAKNMTLKDIANKHKVSFEELSKEAKKGVKVEMEHTQDVNQAYNIAKDHLFEDPKYYTKLATIESMWIKELAPHGYPDQEWMDNHEKKMKKLRKKLDTMNEAQAVSGGKVHKFITGKNLTIKGKKYPSVEFEVIQINNSSQLVKLKVLSPKNLFGNEMNVPFKSIRRGPFFKTDVNEGIILEGGAYGHMNHPFDTEINLTFGQLKDIVNRALDGKLELTREKTDGQALAISWVDGRLVAARNKGHLKNKGAAALDISGVADKFSGRGELEKAYNFAMQDLTKAIKSLSSAQRDKIFKGGSCFMNLEVIYPTSVNVIPYGQPLLVFHGTMEYDIDGNAIGENPEAGRMLAGMVKQVNQHVQDNYTIQGPPVISLPQKQDLSSKKGKYISQISKLQGEFGLGDTAGVAEYHQAWWENWVDKNSPSPLDNKTKMGLVKRWAFFDKSFRLDNKNITDIKVLDWAKKHEKDNHSKIAKDNLMKFENIFLGVGAEVLQFTSSVLTVNPDSAIRDMKKRLDQTIKDVQKSGDVKKLEKLKLELQRLNAIGGPDKIVPIEGIVFQYKGNTFKLTGAFASLNQLLGIFYS